MISTMKIWGFFDASGTQKNADNLGRYSPAVAVSGYLATPKQWSNFEKEWRIVLGIAGIPHFHMTDFVARKKEYECWERKKRDDVFQALLAVIKRNALYGIGALVLLSDYREVVTTDFRRAVVGEPYTFCCTMCLYAASRFAEQIGYNDSIKYVFDHGDEHQREVLAAHTSACNDPEKSAFYRFSVGSLTFDRKDRATPIQAADILAYEMYKEMMRHTYPTEPKRYTRRSLHALLDVPGDYKVYNKDGLMGVIGQAEEHFGYSEGAA
jgi:hypothetical protein